MADKVERGEDIELKERICTIVRRKHLQHFVALAIIILVASFAFQNLLFGPHNKSIGRDVYNIWNYEALTLRNIVLNYGELPLWDNTRLSGVPYLAYPSTYPFYLSAPIVIFAPNPIVGLRYAVVLHAILAGLFMYYLLTVLGSHRLAALIAGIGYMLCGAFVTQIAADFPMIFGYPWVPLVVAFGWRALFERKTKYAPLCGLALAMQVLAGGGITFVYSSVLVIFLIVYSFAHCLVRQSNKTKAKTIWQLAKASALVFVFALGVSAVKLLPVAEFMSYSNRANLPLGFGALGFGDSHIAKVSDVWYYLITKKDYGLGFYVGGPLIALAAIGIFLFLRRGEKVLFFLGAFVLFVVLSMGSSAPVNLHAILYQYFPGYSGFYRLFRSLGIASFALIALAGLGGSAIFDWIERRLNTQVAILVLLVCLVIVTLDLSDLALEANSKLVERPERFSDVWQSLQAGVRDNPKFRLFTIPHLPQYFSDYKVLAKNIQVSSGWGVSFLNNYLPELRGDLVSGYFSAPPTVLDHESLKLLGILNTKYLVTEQKLGLDDVVLVEEVPRFKYENRLFLPRLFTVKRAFLLIGHDRRRDFLYKEAKMLVDFPEFNPAAMAVFRGKSPYIDDYPFELLNEFDGILVADCIPRTKSLEVIGNELEKGGKELICINSNQIINRSLPNETQARIRRLLSKGDDKTTNKSEAEIVRYSPNKIELKIKNYSPNTFILLSEVYFPGWNAYDNGNRIPLYTADGMIRGMLIESVGDHTVVVKYEPLSFKIGAALSIVTLLAMALFYGSFWY